RRPGRARRRDLWRGRAAPARQARPSPRSSPPVATAHFSSCPTLCAAAHQTIIGATRAGSRPRDGELLRRRARIRAPGADRTDSEAMHAGLQVTVGLGRAAGGEFALVDPAFEAQWAWAGAGEPEGDDIARELL